MIYDSIFRPSFGNRPSFLVGRDDFLATFDAALKTRPGSRERSQVILGQRGSGKTVLLWEMADRARKAGFVVSSPAPAAPGLLDKVVERIQEDGERYIRDKKHHVTGVNLGALGFSAGLQFSTKIQETKSFSFKMTKLAQALTACGHGMLILVDELRADSPELRELVLTYQELVSGGFNVALVLAGLPGAVSRTLNEKVLTFLNRAHKVSLPPLAIADIEAFYHQGFREIDISINDALVRQAACDTGGSPYLMQLIGHYIALYASPQIIVGEDDYARALSAAREDFENDVCETTLIALSEQDRAFLYAMVDDDGPSLMGDIADRMQVKSAYAQQYRRRLINSGVIQSAGYGQVRFAVPFLDDYLRREG